MSSGPASVPPARHRFTLNPRPAADTAREGRGRHTRRGPPHLTAHVSRPAELPLPGMCSSSPWCSLCSRGPRGGAHRVWVWRRYDGRCFRPLRRQRGGVWGARLKSRRGGKVLHGLLLCFCFVLERPWTLRVLAAVVFERAGRDGLGREMARRWGSRVSWLGGREGAGYESAGGLHGGNTRELKAILPFACIISPFGTVMATAPISRPAPEQSTHLKTQSETL